jgi:hypothetical protein
MLFAWMEKKMYDKIYVHIHHIIGEKDPFSMPIIFLVLGGFDDRLERSKRVV